MSVSPALEKSAKDFSSKYACNFNFALFEEQIEEFTFLRPNHGWTDAYRMTFERMYRQALASMDHVGGTRLDGEEMLDDFEYTLIRPYVNEGEKEIRHKPYVGMDRISRLEYLTHLTRQAPSNAVELYADEYRRGELSIEQMRSAFVSDARDRTSCVEMAAIAQALEAVNQGRSSLWRFLHPIKNNAEKRDCTSMKQAILEEIADGGALYHEVATAAYKTFDGHERIHANLQERMIHAREEMEQKRKMNDAIRESIRIDGFGRDSLGERSLRVDSHSVPTRGKQI